MKRLCLLIAILLALAGGLFTSPAQAAAITVEADGVSDVLANEFCAIAGQVGQFYQEVYNYSPARAVKIVVVADEAAYARKLTDVDRGFYPLAMTIARGEVMLTARPAQGNSIYWLYEGTVRLLAAQAAEAAGHKSVADAQRGWVDVIKATSDAAPALSEMKGTLSPAMGCYGEEKVMATVSMAVARLAEKTSPDALLRYFTVLRDLNDAPRAFQQVFGLSLEA